MDTQTLLTIIAVLGVIIVLQLAYLCNSMTQERIRETLERISSQLSTSPSDYSQTAWQIETHLQRISDQFQYLAEDLRGRENSGLIAVSDVLEELRELNRQVSGVE